MSLLMVLLQILESQSLTDLHVHVPSAPALVLWEAVAV
jgi:hypothetical protein